MRKDERVLLVRNPIRTGLAASSNAVVEAATSDIIARMDADDLSLPRRLEQQIAVLESDPEAVLVGTLNDGMDERSRVIRPRDRGRLMERGYFAPFPHGSVMFRRRAFTAAGGYRQVTDGFEDVDLFVRIARHGKVYVIPDALYRYRYHVGNTALAFSREERLRSMRNRDKERGLPLASHDAAHEAEFFATRAAMSVWAGMRPRTRTRVSRAIFKGTSGQIARSLLYGTWGNLHPASLRALLAGFVLFRDAYATWRLKPQGPIEWHFA